tara:strand:- start:640 stop:756 length:117 start_codon:yes stop_codon:yes gene_type:complete
MKNDTAHFIIIGAATICLGLFCWSVWVAPLSESLNKPV